MLKFALICTLLGAIGAFFGMQIFPTEAGFIAARMARVLVVCVAAGVLPVLGVLWVRSGHRKTSVLEGIMLAFLSVLMVSVLSLLFWWGVSMDTLQVGWTLGMGMVKKAWWAIVLLGLILHVLKPVAESPR
ncbi:hypothetical protein [Deinococcus misasensis]|uniref:hypothetical protein n=1 Tax=Deinococcus misasensis TaxID=392413 RepID=UPI000555961B|nr:hypothetical protein [Deinococcus misasensis]